MQRGQGARNCDQKPGAARCWMRPGAWPGRQFTDSASKTYIQHLRTYEHTVRRYHQNHGLRHACT